MVQVKDRIMLGILTGAVAGIPGRLLNAWEYRKGMTDVKYGQMASSIFLPANKVDTAEGNFIGSITNHISLGITGILVTYLLSATGRDKAILKGVGVSSIGWLAVYGLASRLNITIKSKKPVSPILSFFDHVSLGALCGLIAAQLGDDSLFPPRERLSGERLPIIETD